MIIGIILVAAAPLALGALAGWDTDGFHPRHFLYGLAVGVALVLGTGAVLLLFEGIAAFALVTLLLFIVLVVTVRSRRADRDRNPDDQRSVPLSGDRHR